MDSFRSGSRDISLTIYGLTKTIKGLSESTVCDDVIETVFDTLAISKVYASSFAIYEFASGIQRQLPGKTRVLKLVRSWGAEHAQYKLIMKRIENLNKNVGAVSEDSSLSTEDNKYFNIQNKEEKNFTVMHKNCYPDEKTPKLKRSKGCAKIQNISRIRKAHNSEQFRSLALPAAPETSGKMFILKKYLNDVMVYHKNMKRYSPKVQVVPRSLGDESELECTPRLRNFQNDISSIRNSKNDSRFTELGENIRTPGDGEHSVSASSESLDVAFVGTDVSEIRAGTCKNTEEFNSLNDAFLVTGEDLYESDSDISDGIETNRFYHNLDFTKDKSNVQRSKGAPEKGHTKRFNRLSTLKNILASASSGSPSSASGEDDLLESFMDTKLHENNSFRQCL